ncbi:hypothetical protein FJR48_09825 [Sulfurimonas lithotrophica]|uniref:Imelysin-like domain-containing protein n=1 Tax=Sulfurimonas lithotrophica TaxID=2590022 RepID=A0A5P8P2V2_9BACT|nr:imelysin family protein [Sulfurimonas lithotrophica]QFR50005.1 hypothetical protein FJR48_09825 [Sulfurimonas lithotrophica]
MLFNNLKIFLILVISLMFIACGDENNYDGQNGLLSANASAQSIDAAIGSIYDEVIYKDANATYEQSLNLLASIEDLNSTKSEADLIEAQNGFKQLVLFYKRVEAVYVAGYNDDNMRDIADFYIEHYIKGSKSQDTAGDLEEVFSGTKTLVSNSLKGITALEYTLFGDKEDSSTLIAKMNQNRLDAALLMINKISSHLLEIKEYYESTSEFTTSSEDSVSALLNVLVQQALNLREIRIGEAAGLVVKYADDPSADRLEYYYSSYSLEAIKEILNTYKKVIQNGLESIAELGSSSSELKAVSDAINEALSICDSYSSTLENELTSQKTTNLFESVRTIQNNYTALITGLNFEQDILEADGD